MTLRTERKRRTNTPSKQNFPCTSEYRVVRHIEFCYGHRLMDYEGPCRLIHGHNGKIEIELASGSLDSRSMVVDFNDINQIVKSWVDRTFDHKLILRKDDPLISVLEKIGEEFAVTEENPTAEHLAKIIFEFVHAEGLPVKSVTLWETDHSAAVYRLLSPPSGSTA